MCSVCAPITWFANYLPAYPRRPAYSQPPTSYTHVERLQCYRGVTEDKAIGRFDEGLQRLYMEFSKGQHENWQTVQASLKGRDFFRPGPLMRALECNRPCVLLIDELDKVDEGFEAMLLEILSGWTLSIPEFGTVAAKSIPFVVLTSNEERRLGDPIRRRSLYVRVEHPTPEREAEIIASRTPKTDEKFHREMAGIALSFRNYSLEKPPSVSEMIDFANALQLLGTDHVTEEHRDVLLPFLAKTDDILYLLALELRAMRKRIGFVLSDAFRRSLLETRTLTNSNNSEVVPLRDFLSGNQL
jgi:MoxR-like ATPase